MNHKETDDFTLVAAAYLDERAPRTGETLARYVERYPQYAPDLLLLTMETAVAEAQTPPMATPPPDLLRRLRADARATLAPRPAFSSLLGQAREHAGLTPRALAAQLGVGVDVLALLEERHVRVETVVTPFLRRLAGLVGASVAAVQGYLALPPLAASPGVAYHAPRGHSAARSLSFAEAIAESALTTPQQKERWLSTGDDGDGDGDDGEIGS